MMQDNMQNLSDSFSKQGGARPDGNRLYINAAIGTVFAFIWALATEHYAFQTQTQTIANLRLLYIPVCFTALYFAQKVWERRREKEVQFAIRAFLIYEIFNCIFLLLIYPGAWKWDDLGIYNMLAIDGQLFYWQHYLSAVFYAFALFLIPFPAGVVFVQVSVISLIFGYCAYVLRRIPAWARCNSKFKYAILAPFFFLPTVDFNLWPLRLSLYCMLEVLLVVVIIEPKLTGRGDIWEYRGRCLFLVVLTAVLSSWRTEGLLYFVMVPLLMFILYPGKARVIPCALMLLCCMVSAIAALLPQKAGMGDSKDYELTGILLPMQPLVHKAAEDHNQEILSAVDKVVDVNVMLDGYENGTNAITLFWDGNAHLVRDNFTESDYSNFSRVYLKLIFRYPGSFLQERFRTFLDTWKCPGTGNIGWLYSSDEPSVSIFAHNYYFNRPLNNELRVKVGEILNAEGDGWKWSIWMFNYYAQAAALVVFTILLAVKRSKYFFVALVMEVRMVLTFLTAPDVFFMYYYNLWLFGNFVIFGAIGAVICKKLVMGERRKRRAETDG